MAELWRSITEGRDHLEDVPASRWLVDDYYASDPRAVDRTYSRRGGFIPDVDFDPVEWGIPPAALASTDPVQLLALLVAKQALRDAFGSAADDVDGERVSVFIGASGATQLATTMAARLQRPVWRRALVASGLPEAQADEVCDRIAREYPAWTESVFPGYLNNVIAGRVANRLNLRGTNCTTDAACASSLAALKMGAQELWLGEADLVLTGGADALCDPLGFLSFAKCSALSRTDDCRPFSSKADGTIISEGVGMILLERLEDAERNGRRIYAVIRGIGSSSDGRGTAIYAPSPEGQALAMRRAYRNAGVNPDTVELLEAHGTGTPAGEVAEVQAAREVFESSGRGDRGWCALGSIKSQIGHTKAAAGVAGIVKAALALHHKVIPPTIKVDVPNPELDLASSPFYVSTRSRPWIGDSAHPRRAAVSSFGFGGTNFHVVLEEYGEGEAARAARISTAPVELVVVTGADAGGTAQSCLGLADELSRRPGQLSELARGSRREYSHAAPVRVAVVAARADEIATKLRAPAEGLRGEAGIDVAGVAHGAGPHEGRVAFLFPGQGSHYLGMSGSLAMEYAEARVPWDRAASLQLDADRRLHEVVFPAPAFGAEENERQLQRLTATEWAQPALAAASMAWLAVLEKLAIRPDCVAGHSFGELVALHAAGVLSDSALLQVARRRGELMRDASGGKGAMTAVVASWEQATEVLRGVDDVVIANHNSPSQIVISGRAGAVDAVERTLADRGIAFTRLPVSSAFHSPLVSGCATPFLEYLESVQLQPPSMEVYGNSSTAPYPDDPREIRTKLARQLSEPVRFVEEVTAMYDAGVRTFIEVGPRAVLSRLVAATLQGRPHRAVAVDDGSGGMSCWYSALAQIVAAGIPVDLAALDSADVTNPQAARQRSKVSVSINGSLRAQTDRPAPPLPPTYRPARDVSAAGTSARVAAGAVHAGGDGIARPILLGANGQAAAAHVPAHAHDPAQPPARSAAAVLRRRLLDVHANYQRAMAEAHRAFMDSAESSLRSIATSAPLPPVSEVLAHDRAVPGFEVSRHDPRQMLRDGAANAAVATGPQRSVRRASTREDHALDDHPPANGPEVAASGGDMMALLESVISEKTGFPAEAVQPDLDLERDLGIDSIKRVEILAELRQRVPALADIKPASLATHRTLSDVAQLLRAVVGGSTGAALPPQPAETSASGEAQRDRGADLAVPEAGTVRDILQSLISEKTGFPLDLINADTDLQQDLGVDSIKRVEVLVALRSLIPALAGVQPHELASLKTVAQISEFLSRRAAS